MSVPAKQTKNTKRELPAGWCWVRLGELSDPTKGSSRIGPFGSSLRKDELSESGIPVIGIENVLPNRFEQHFRRFISATKYTELKDYTVKPGDVLVSTMGTIGRSAVVPDNIETAIIDSHLFRFRLNRAEADPTFICYAINGLDSLKQQLETKSSGAIMAGLNTTILRECLVQLPPLPEQRRIARVLREQMAVVDKVRTAAQARLEAVKTLPSALLSEVFPKSDVVLPVGWCWIRLGKVTSIHPGQHIMEADYNYNNIGVGYLTGPADFGESTAVITKWTDKPKTFAEPGDILVTVKGAGVGKANLAPTEKVAIGRQLMAVRVIPSLIMGDYLYYFVLTQLTTLSEKALGATVPGLGREDLESLMLPLPPLSKQRRIAEVLREQLSAVEKARAAAEAELNTINALPVALLRCAFNGEI